MPMFEYAMTFIEDILCEDINLNWLFIKIKKSYNEVNYGTTLKLLARARIAQQIKDDAKVLICKYLDILQLEKMINQLRDETVADSLIREQIDIIVRSGVFFMTRSNKFLQDYNKTFKEGLLLMNGVNTQIKIQSILSSFGVMQENYKDIERDDN